ncbi:high-affinity branched-chain amino acid ABC transporter permease LivM [Methylobacterium sp. E-045]|uniref:high-affinity branched-chain amino acid ABC transporter permease LivM n=1 Tax=Methylobacterium sp. E-045 TaxID=2836575 RepID=UPI001FB9B135|nr:high-affinity branched-chain amino acid ABC transporter permease LivM [Methylobacterium sp. E-045]
MATGSTTPIPVTDRAEASALPSLIKDAGLFALVTLGLCVPIVSYRTDLGQGIGLVITSRWGTVFALCAAIFVLRLVQQLYLTGRARRRAARAPVAEGASRLAAILAPITLVIALTLPLLAALLTGSLGEGRYWIDLGILILTYVMLGWGLNIVVGLAGLLDLGYVAFYAVGAYSYALLSTVFGLSFWICLPLAGLFAAAFGVLLGFPVLRLRGDYLAIVTLAFGEIIRLVLINWTDFSGGAAGISSIPRVSFFGLPFTAGENGFAATFGLNFNAMHRLVFLYYLILALALVTNLVTLRMRRLPLGRAWEALREDEIACRSLGIDTTITKLTAFALGAMFAGFAGSFFAVRQAFVSPESFNFLESAIILAIVVLGGMGSQIGVAIAAIVMIGAPELLRNLGFLKAVFGEGFDPNEYRLLLFGLAMVAMMVFRPRGLISERTPSVTIAERGR